MYYALVRTFSNSFETYFTIIAFYYWPFANRLIFKENTFFFHSFEYIRRRRISLIFASIACLIRITNVFIWIPIAFRELFIIVYYSSSMIKDIWIFCKQILFIGFASIFILIAFDSWYYQRYFTVTAYNFYYFNTVLNGSVLYGTHAFYWYFFIGMPAVIGTLFPAMYFAMEYILGKYFIDGNWYLLITKLYPLICCLFTVMVFSFNEHKEFRFLLPLLPIFIIYCGLGLNAMLEKYEHWKYFRIIVFVILLITNCVSGLFLSAYHQRGSIQVMDEIYSDIVANRMEYQMSEFNAISVDFLVECHSTPMYSYLHLNGFETIDNHLQLNFLECNPHFDDGGVLTRNETPSWYLETQPKLFFDRYYAKNSNCASYCVISSENESFFIESSKQCRKKYREIGRYIDNYFTGKYFILYSS